jgi:hypothetical protein
MVPGGVTEILWHFIGHLRTIDDIARDRIGYDEGAPQEKLDDYKTDRPSFDARPDLDEFSTAPIPPPDIQLLDAIHALRALPSKHGSLPPFDADSDSNLLRPTPPVYFGGGGGGGASDDIRIVYEKGGDQTELQVNQWNILSDNDVIGYGSGSITILAGANQLSFDASKLLLHMADEANMQIPSAWWMEQTNTGVIVAVQEFDKEQVDHGGVPNANSVAPGYYLNGELQTPTSNPPTPLLGGDTTHDTGHGLGLWADAGGNVSFNGALIVDLSASAHSMIVMGNYFHTNAIFQTNSTMDQDHINAPDADPSAIVKGQDTADNIADFIQHPGVWASVPATFAGPQWHVDVVHGDFYSIHTVVQTNYLLDNDVIIQQGGGTHFNLVTGGNELGNLAQVFDGSIHYDLIVVQGAYHGMNVIFQNNILLNNDNITLATGDGTDPTQSVISGQNQLLNAATIENYGNNSFHPISDGLHGIVNSLGNGATDLDIQNGNLLPGSGGTFNVLYITGDYYDVNSVWQTNVTSDVNVLLQLLDAPSGAVQALHPDDQGTQSVITGQDKLTNDAVIVDVGPTNAYVGGQVYGDSILVQANLLPTDGDHAVNHDMNALVPELVAFVNEHQDETRDTPPAAPPPPPHDDAICNVMH